MSRSWSLASAFNFRDIGGLATVDGEQVKRGLLFRSATPQFLTEADAEQLLTAGGLKLVIDLRFGHEIDAEGSGPLGRAAVRNLKIPIVGAGGDVIGNALLSDALDTLGEHYVSYVEINAGAFVEIVRALAGADGTPALLHCAAGKDRTGVAVALLLSLLGVPDEAIIAEYALTAEQMPGLLRRLAATPTYGPSLALQHLDDPLSKARPETMRAFLDWLAATHGSARDLLVSAGLEPEAVDGLRERFLDRAAA